MVNIEPIKSSLKLEVLSDSQVADIRNATLQVLETVGINFPSEKALQIFADHGAQVDSEKQIVRMKPDLVLEAMSHAQRSYEIGRASCRERV